MRIKSLHIDAYKCECNLNDSKLLLAAFIKAAKSINAKIVKEIVYKYKPQGISIVLLLAETHASVFTWPEFDYAAVEIFLCNENMDPYIFLGVIKDILKPEKICIKELVREVK